MGLLKEHTRAMEHICLKGRAAAFAGSYRAYSEYFKMHEGKDQSPAIPVEWFKEQYLKARIEHRKQFPRKWKVVL